MTNIYATASAGVLALALVCGASAAHATTPNFPGYGNDTLGPEFLLTVGPGGSTSITLNPIYTTDPGTYDGSDDTYIGVINDSGGTVSSISLSSTSPIFGFDGDGLSAARFGGPGNSTDSTGYGGPEGYFTSITTGSVNSGNINFIGGIPNGGSDYFALEAALTTASVTPTNPVISGAPEPGTWALMMAGVFGIGLALRRGLKTGRRTHALA